MLLFPSAFGGQPNPDGGRRPRRPSRAAVSMCRTSRHHGGADDIRRAVLLGHARQMQVEQRQIDELRLVASVIGLLCCLQMLDGFGPVLFRRDHGTESPICSLTLQSMRGPGGTREE